MNKEDEGQLDIFIRNSIYPEAEGIFSFRPKSLQTIKNDCFVVLDTNALLVPYTTGKDSLNQIASIYQSLVKTNRLTIPGQVAREFAEHRVTKIKELYQQISRKQVKLNLGNYPLLDNVSEYQKAHELEKELNESIRTYNKTITAILDVIGNWYWDDPVSTLYGELFAADVVVEPVIGHDDIKKRLEKDSLYKLPPGYKDAAKDDEGIGDLLIWQTILDIGRTSGKSVIFVSLDRKADWLSQSEGRPLYPRYELIDEFRRVSSGQSFHILKFSSFLDLFGATEEVVEEVRKEEIQSVIELTLPPDRHALRHGLQAEEAVFKWLWRQYPERVAFAERLDRVDIKINNIDGSLVGVEVKYMRHSVNPMFIRRRISLWLSQLAAAEKYSSLLLAVVVENDATLGILTSKLNRMEFPVPNLTVTVGRLSEDGEFQAVYSRSS